MMVLMKKIIMLDKTDRDDLLNIDFGSWNNSLQRKFINKDKNNGP